MAMQGAFNFRRLTHFTFEMRGAKDSMGPVWKGTPPRAGDRGMLRDSNRLAIEVCPAMDSAIDRKTLHYLLAFMRM
jgi:hypothetical protein